jgi:signal transduction histidine kinase
MSSDRVSQLADTQLMADFAEIHRAVSQLTEMVSDVLDVSRLEADSMPLQRAPIDLRQVAAEAIASLGIPRHASVEFSPPAQPVIALADPDVLRRVIANLVGNAVKFTPRGGRARVRVARASSGPEVRVSDTGPGIPAEFHERIFEKFGQARGDGRPGVRSSGLGLTFCKLAVEAHGGRIHLESEVGKGSTFRFTVPAP